MKPRPEPRLQVPGVLQRTLAGLLSATILLLAALAVSPSAHERIHAHAGEADHSCAITLFAQGVTSPLCQVELPAPLELSAATVRLGGPELRLIAPRYFLKPLRGPPVS